MSMQEFWEVVRQVIEESNVVIEVLDARMPQETRNRKAEKMVKLYRKPLIFAVNKADLVRMGTVRENRRILEKDAPCVFVCTKNRRGITFLKKKIFEIAKKRSRRRMLSVGVIGYPNTGKSSLINALAGRKKAKVSPIPGFTRGVQWISGGPDIRLLDTPGVIPLSEEDKLKQALTGVLDSSRVEDPEDVARSIIKTFLEKDKKAFERFYGIEVKTKRFDFIISKLGKARNMLKKGGMIDEKRVYFMIINDWQKGKLLLKK
ncbi:MAG: GTPase [Candidatus Aenigmarchaeota archaeon CG_4_10_14_0_8_um_filter_37_24]|nr:GTPase [Candidatus Aenigmarchaeota archaeon]PIV69587.1 MAG: GTPase [Candidatus Aenigmarchaeota archaeon CG01_land_8_20_14_3_00_37_9]PIW41693.1 MAG: GTPase [Candidatus Aenigmarchaeota archaeon CG15_BIG_FIL_POST_REV_8_21_14_020_37_27]PIX50333.1 MAG: GTPase [Candidatus Aenigmarchaeota archaeon CG_4_8_14_3_um_filter_37_24]PIY35463.1 MAG: GTPase [Candidatus Aenigmarchaeota archaeon CG_4_10_14_3_um_filter_37_21]PIZ33477.1 MAG: GTPase [Candidatus Aenigmarchaeota archaeon CG_4_10_14_0_8_um_filter_3